MRLLHVADLHVGKTMSGFSLREDHKHILRQICDQVRDLHADALLVPGDLYDKSAPSNESVAVVDRFLSEAARCAPVFVTGGNHDAAERIGYGARLLAREGLYLSPVYDGTIAHYTLQDEYGPVTFWLIPFLKPSYVRRYYPDEEIGDYTDMMRVALAHCDIDRTQRNVALSHQFVTGDNFNPMADYLAKHPDADIEVGGLNNIDASAYDPFDYVALGHIHKAHEVGRPSVRYCGSPLRFSADADQLADEKTITVVDLGPKEPGQAWAQVEVSTVPFRPLHDVRAIKGPLEELVKAEVVDAAPADDYLRVTITDEVPPVDALARLHACYPNILEFLVDNTSTRAAGVGGADLGSVDVERSLPDLFDEFFRAQNDRDMSEGQRLAVATALEKCEVR